MPDAAPPYRCATAALARQDALSGSAVPNRRWLLVEQPGPWGLRGLWDSVAHRTARELLARAADADARLLLVRRPGRNPARGQRRWYFCDTSLGHELLVTGVFERVDDLLDLPLDGSAGRTVRTPLFLVCTHSRHDPCCAIRGRPAAAALALVRPELTWECSHLGGDRFAGNVLTLPGGIYHGTVRYDDAERLVHATEDDRVVLDLLRGRCGIRPVEQIAEQAVLTRTGDDRRTAAVAVNAEQTSPGRWDVQVRTADGPAHVQVQERRVDVAEPLTCHGSPDTTYLTHDVLDVQLPYVRA